MKEVIGETAGKIWSALKNNEEINVSQLPKMISKKPVIAYQALGWLAREGKIVYHTIKEAKSIFHWMKFKDVSDCVRNSVK